MFGQTTKFCPWTNVVCKNVAQTDAAWTNVARTDVAWTNDAWTNVAWSNGSGPLDNSQGWDQSDWTENSWDTYGLSRIRTFYADGSTNTFTFPSAPAVGEVYTTYFDGVLQASQVFHGDGSTLSFTLSSTPANGVKVEFIPFDDDGVQTPTDDRTLDTLLIHCFGSNVAVPLGGLIVRVPMWA